MTHQEIVKLSDAKLHELISEKRQTLQGLRFGKTERNTQAARQLRVEIARAHTELKRRAEAPANTQ